MSRTNGTASARGAPTRRHDHHNRPPPPPYTGPASPPAPAAPTGLPGAADPPSQRGAAAHRPRPGPSARRKRNWRAAEAGGPGCARGRFGRDPRDGPGGELSARGGPGGGLHGQLCRQCAFSVVNL
ncbi:collagen alpha-1(I) chain-like [Empidonax traillii]|uniref:collagen alpha-1(I) chain-like n=1 Tax=Empidonax traillii TaxID=164674 RepID=UPI000FFDB867|nr:collagen alpha-1(I) chain-like [Empidonax traillii]